LAWLVDPTNPYQRSGHTSTIDQAHIRESPPVRHDALTTEPRRQLIFYEGKIRDASPKLTVEGGYITIPQYGLLTGQPARLQHAFF